MAHLAFNFDLTDYHYNQIITKEYMFFVDIPAELNFGNGSGTDVSMYIYIAIFLFCSHC